MKDISAQAKSIMGEFAQITGLQPKDLPLRRYLWTDAFAVCNYLGFYEDTGEQSSLELVFQLINQVHHSLGRHRPDDQRSGWISGLEETEGEKHPTKGGLRIGKELNERGIGEPRDPRVEWERDGQYFHYLTKWMHTLNRTSQVSGRPVFHQWAVELAQTAYEAFIYTLEPDENPAMYWTMSIDLSRPLVPSMGQHDPLDGLITYTQLQTTNKLMGLDSADQDLSSEIQGFANMCAGRSWTTDDPLGLGGLFTDAFKVGLLLKRQASINKELLDVLLKEGLAGLRDFGRRNLLNLPSSYRLAFRELGLAIGLKALDRLDKLFKTELEFDPPPELKSILDVIELADVIERFWLSPENQAGDTWQEHREINMVMLATSLAPDGYLGL